MSVTVFLYMIRYLCKTHIQTQRLIISIDFWQEIRGKMWSYEVSHQRRQIAVQYLIIIFLSGQHFVVGLGMTQKMTWQVFGQDLDLSLDSRSGLVFKFSPTEFKRLCKYLDDFRRISVMNWIWILHLLYQLIDLELALKPLNRIFLFFK